MSDEAFDDLKRIPLFKDVPSSQVTFERLGSFTNRSYKISSPLGEYFLRVVGDGEAATLDRRIERHNLEIVEKAGLTAETLYFDPHDGLMLSRFLSGARLLTGPILNADTGSLRRAGKSLRRLHDCTPQFRGSFEVSGHVEECLAEIHRLGAAPPPGFVETYLATKRIRDTLKRMDWQPAPCHIDPLAENFLDSGDKVYIVDFEYSAPYDPMWDVGDFAVEAELGPEQELALMRSYFDGEPPEQAWARMAMYKVLADFYWSLVGMVHFANENPVEDWWAYSTNRFARGKKLMDDETFKRHLQVVYGSVQPDG
jgi:thiamine kinase-like enzyme